MEKDYIERLKKQLELSISNSDLETVLKAQFKTIKNDITNIDFSNFLKTQKNNLLENLEDSKNPLFKNSQSENVRSLLKHKTLQENQEMIFPVLEKINAREHLDVYVEMFAANNLPDYFKTRLFFILAEQQVDQEFLLRKSFKKFVVNPCKMDVVEKLALLGSLKKAIERRIGFINLGWLNIANLLAENYFFVVFPDWPDSEYARNSLVYAILDSAKNLLGVEEEISFHKIEYSEEYVKEFKEFFINHKILD